MILMRCHCYTTQNRSHHKNAIARHTLSGTLLIPQKYLLSDIEKIISIFAWTLMHLSLFSSPSTFKSNYFILIPA